MDEEVARRPWSCSQKRRTNGLLAAPGLEYRPSRGRHAGESDSFEPRLQVRDLSAPGAILREVDGLLRVDPPEVSMFAMPRRNRRPPAVRLAPGQWLQWLINYRFVGSCGGAWSYQLETFDIVYGFAAPDVFLGVPTRRADERRALR
ncbi:hypothetical protein [Streptomyces adustus]